MRGWAPVVLVAAGALSACGACAQLAGPEAEIANALHALGERGTTDTLAGLGDLKVSRARFDRLLIKPEGEGFVAVGTVDAEAILGAGTAVSYLGIERVAFRVVDRSWKPAGPLLPALTQVLELLSRRNQALQSGDQAALRALGLETAEGESGPRRVRSWTVRVERDGAQVLEEFSRPDAQGVWRDGRKRMRLVRGNGEFRFAAGMR